MFVCTRAGPQSPSPWRDIDDAIDDCDGLIMLIFERIGESGAALTRWRSSVLSAAQWFLRGQRARKRG